MTTFYDSMSEAEFAAQLKSAYGYAKSDTIYNTGAVDKVGTIFNWKCDFSCENEALPLIEFKSGTLNSRKEKLKADVALEKANASGFGSELANISKLSWSNSVYKHEAVAASLPHLKYIVIFKHPPTESDAQRYLKQNILFCTVAALPSMLAAILFAKHGVKSFVFTQNTKDYSITYA